MTDLKNLQHGAQMPSSSDPMTFQRPSLSDATQSTINQTSYDPAEPHQPSRFKQHFNKQPGEKADERGYIPGV
jgi:hypothetical protein